MNKPIGRGSQKDPAKTFFKPRKSITRIKDNKVFEVVCHNAAGLWAKDLKTGEVTKFDPSYFRAGT